MSTGKELRVIPEELVKWNNAEFRGFGKFARIHFETMKRMLENERPYYAS